MKIIKALPFIALILSCNAPAEKSSALIVYRQDGAEPVAWLAVERSGPPAIMASSFLINKEKGLFLTAKHFVQDFNLLSFDTCKLFINGRVYEAYVLQVPPLADAAMLQLVEFNLEDLPDPYPVAKEKVKIGDRVFVRGLHLHRKALTKHNLKRDIVDKVVPIISDYYDNYGYAEKSSASQVVYENIPSVVVEIDVRASVDGNEGLFGAIKDKYNRYVHVETVYDHVDSFGGLSGGVMVNEGGEIVGIITLEQVGFETVPFFGPFLMNVKTYENIFVTPIEYFRELFDYAETL